MPRRERRRNLTHYNVVVLPPRCSVASAFPCHPISRLVTLLKASFDTEAADDRSIGCNTLARQSLLRTSDPLIPLITSYNFAEGEEAAAAAAAAAAAVASRLDCDSADLMGHSASHFSANGIAS